MEDFNIEDWRKAGMIAKQALLHGKTLIKKGASHKEVSDRIEEKIIQLGGGIAFPVQMSMNEVAAHFCASEDEKIIFEDQLVSLDVGVHINGAIGDNALTVDLSGRYSELVKASEDALSQAAKVLQAGIRLSEVGRTIQETIESYGFKPIRNLSGHGLSLYNIHDFPTVPNYNTGEKDVLEEGMVIAIEPFATDGAGLIVESGEGNVFAFEQKRPVRSQITRDVLKEISSYSGLPFTTRWLLRKYPAFKVNFALKDLMTANVIRSYPPLIEKNKGMVSQAENTFYIGDKVEILTKDK